MQLNGRIGRSNLAYPWTTLVPLPPDDVPGALSEVKLPAGQKL